MNGRAADAPPPPPPSPPPPPPPSPPPPRLSRLSVTMLIWQHTQAKSAAYTAFASASRACMGGREEVKMTGGGRAEIEPRSS